MYGNNLYITKWIFFFSTLHNQQGSVILNLKSDIFTGKFLIVLYCKNIHFQPMKCNYFYQTNEFVPYKNKSYVTWYIHTYQSYNQCTTMNLKDWWEIQKFRQLNIVKIKDAYSLERIQYAYDQNDGNFYSLMICMLPYSLGLRGQKSRK
jgi:hypothetical protein